MKKILAVCGSGLGSSFMLELNIKSVLQDLGVSNYSVAHSDITSLSADGADILVCGRDLDDATKHFKGTKIILNNIVDKNELKEKLSKIVK